MAQAYGSVAHPVNLGPFRRIVNVHWSGLTHIAFQVHVKSSVTITNPGVEWAGEFYESITALEDAIDYLGSSELVYASQPASTFEGWNGRAWGPLTEDPTVDGFPDLSGSAATYSAWEYRGAKSIAIPPLFNDVPRAEWAAASGDGTGIFVPDVDGPEFKQGSANIHLNAEAITGSPRWVGIGLPFPGPPDFIFWAAPYSHSTTPIGSTGFAIDDFVVTYKGKAFRGIASAPVTVMEPSPSYYVQSSVLWVLCARSTADDPTS
ncbi:MAG: hypothetical protein EOS65_02705 [Mesorhizobium sp.]|uniref:hypothetical protein n=1 Tax=Mesorhizobium sp. TaxID=1871066 RepID=UPI000FE86406|nr:hypothetical protein [Mesorhizobium sp.]RWF44305.1 MAG: hypothetical protein EOS65_02705 [Mesorhizobium sp.]